MSAMDVCTAGIRIVRAFVFLFVPDLFVGMAFDAGGVASGP